MIGVNPYIMFKGNCQEAIEFYKGALGAELIYSQTWGESPMSEPGMEDKIMHASLKIGESTIMMADGAESDVPADSNISLAIGMNEVEKAKEAFNNLADGGSVTMPLDKTFWAEAFGMLTDKFGVKWMVNCDSAKETDRTAAA
jgi:PhnB protein